LYKKATSFEIPDDRSYRPERNTGGPGDITIGSFGQLWSAKDHEKNLHACGSERPIACLVLDVRRARLTGHIDH
jgi:hypothetical protein